jgi:putative phage-type endonuclease
LKRANNFKQNSKEWYAWRGKGLGASDAPAIMGDSPWTTKFELWGQKTGLLPRPDLHPFAVSAMERGKLLEPKVREWYRQKTGYVLEADVNCEHPTYEFLRASLDGWRDEDQIVREIKCPGKVDHATALKGRVPTKYVPQVQFQLFVTGAQVAEYISFDGQDGVVIIVPRNDEYISRLESEALLFWELVKNNEPPKVEASDLNRLVSQISQLTEKKARLVSALELVAQCLSGTRPKRMPMAKIVDGEEMEAM